MDIYNGSDCSEAISNFITSNFDFVNELAGITTIEGCTSQFIQFGESCGSLNSIVSAFQQHAKSKTSLEKEPYKHRK